MINLISFLFLGTYTIEQRCDFRADCKDNTDEKTCPNVYIFDDCKQVTGDDDCGWNEEPKDSLDWKIFNQEDSGVSG